MHNQVKNSASSLMLQLVTILSGFILPKLMIETFGSDVNGLGGSITQFLSYITLLEAGVGGVVRAALYNKLADKDTVGISKLIKATEKFFRKLALIFVVYVIVLMFIYPTYINSTFDFTFTASLIIIISVSSIIQYCFSISYSILLQADQKNYISNNLQIITCLINTILSIILINIGAPYHIIKLVGVVVFVIRPIFLNYYIRKKYSLDLKGEYDKKSLSQRWNALAHHVAWFLHTNTDIVIITIFSSLSNVSVYSVYYMITNGISMVSTSLVNGFEAMFGNIMAAEGNEQARKKFVYYSMFMNSIVIVMFSTAAAMIIPFVRIYVGDIKDVNYIVPMLGYLLILSEAMYCLRIPYHSIVTAAGHFKQTQVSAFIEAGSNIVLSICLIHTMGLPGVALATLLSMSYRTVYYIIYLSKNILHISMASNFTQVFLAIVIVIVFAVIKNVFFDVLASNYVAWALQSVVCVLIASIVAVIYNLIFFKPQFITFLKMFCNKFNINKTRT